MVFFGIFYDHYLKFVYWKKPDSLRSFVLTFNGWSLYVIFFLIMNPLIYLVFFLWPKRKVWLLIRTELVMLVRHQFPYSLFITLWCIFSFWIQCRFFFGYFLLAQFSVCLLTRTSVTSLLRIQFCVRSLWNYAVFLQVSEANEVFIRCHIWVALSTLNRL